MFPSSILGNATAFYPNTTVIPVTTNLTTAQTTSLSGIRATVDILSCFAILKY